MASIQYKGITVRIQVSNVNRRQHRKSLKLGSHGTHIKSNYFVVFYSSILLTGTGFKFKKDRVMGEIWAT
jgi:hypothetical protein